MWTFDVTVFGVQSDRTSAQSLAEILGDALEKNGMMYSSMQITNRDEPGVSFETKEKD